MILRRLKFARGLLVMRFWMKFQETCILVGIILQLEKAFLEVANVKLLSKGINISFMCSIRDITAEVGAAVLRAAVAEDLAEGHGDVGARELQHMSKVQKCY